MSVANAICVFFSWFSVAALLVMISITLVDVFLRFFFNSPIVGATEIARMMMICLSPAFAKVMLNGNHVKVGAVVDLFGRKGQLAFDTFGHLAAAAICGLMSYQAIIDMQRRMAQSWVYTLLKIPAWPFYAMFAFAMGLFTIAIIIKLISNFADKELYAKQKK